jgi:MscS family membrane protein
MGHDELEAWLTSAALLVGSYVVARLVSWLFAKVLARLARRTATPSDDRLVAALERPVAYALFLVGAYLAVERLPISARWSGRLELALVVWAIVLTTIALLRAYGILLRWFATESSLARADGPATEFAPLFGKVGKVFIILVGLIVVLQQLGVNVASLVVSLGVGSLAVGLAAQDTLANMFAGFTLMVDRPFLIGERIQLATGEVGDVETIGIRATRIRTTDDAILVVPNSALVKERVVNVSRPTRALATRLDVTLAYGADVEAGKEILVAAARGSGRVESDRPPVAVVQRLSDLGVQLTLTFWVRDYTEQGLTRDEVATTALRLFGERGIEIARLPTPRPPSAG